MKHHTLMTSETLRAFARSSLSSPGKLPNANAANEEAIPHLRYLDSHASSFVDHGKHAVWKKPA